MKKILTFIAFVAFFGFNSEASLLLKNEKRELKTFASILKQMDPNILQSEDSASMENHLKPIADELIEYGTEKYGEEFSSEFSELSTQQVILAAISLVPFESRDNLELGISEGTEMNSGEMWDCLWTGVGAAVSITGLIKDIQTMWTSGATASLGIRVVSRIFRQYFGWFLAAQVAYEFGDCMGWW